VDIDLNEPFAVERWGVAEPLPQPWPTSLQRLILELEDGRELERWPRMVSRARTLYARRRGVEAPTVPAFEVSPEGSLRTTGSMRSPMPTVDFALTPNVTASTPAVQEPASASDDASGMAAGILRSRKRTTGEYDALATLTRGARVAPVLSVRKPGQD
jgi:hypothetical protein